MELYTTKKISSVEEFGLATVDTLPNMHIITPEVIIKTDSNDNMYIADCPSDPSCITNLIKIKKLLCKQEGTGTKLMDDIIWVRPSPLMLYKKNTETVSLNRMVLNHPIKLQLSCKNNYIYSIGKPYNVYNMFWVIDYVMVNENFDWNTISPSK